MERARIRVFDTTLRDGEQSPGCSMNVQEKLRLAHQLDRLGVDVIEAGFPIASEGDFAAVQAIAAAIRRPIIAGLARACAPDIERAWQALKGAARPRIHVFLATSDIHLQYKLQDFAPAVPGAGARFSPPGEVAVRRRGIFSRGRHPYRSRISVPGPRCGSRGWGNNPQYSGHGRLQHAGGIWRAHSKHSAARAGHRECDHLSPLPQRSWTGGGQFPGRGRRGRAAGGVHDQRHWRAGGQRLTGRNRDGDASPARPLCV